MAGFDPSAEALIDGERAFMLQRHVNLPTELTAPVLADSDTSDDE